MLTQKLGNVEYMLPFTARNNEVCDACNYVVATCFNAQVARDVAHALNMNSNKS